MILQGSFQLPSLWFCDHIRPLCLGSLTAAECSLALRGRSREQREPKPRPPAGSPRQQRRAEFRESRGPSLVSSSQKAPTLSVGLGPLFLFLLGISPIVLPGFQSPAGDSCPKSDTQACRVSLCLLPIFLLVCWLRPPLRAPEFWVGIQLGLPLLPWLCWRKNLVDPYPGMHTDTYAHFRLLQ